MLDAMRKSSQSFLIYLIFGAIILVFAINFGPGSGSCSPVPQNYAAVVDGDVITRQEFDALYSLRRDALRRSYQRANREMTPEVLEKLFDPFFTTKAHGTGLGLAVSRRIIQSFGGDMHCASAPGEGARFSVRIPVWREAT